MGTTYDHATSTRETLSKEEEAVLCFCGFREGSSRRGGEMGFEEPGCGLVSHPHSYSIVYRGLHCS